MFLFTAIKRWKDKVVPMASSIVQMLGVDFGRVEYMFFAGVKGNSVDPIFAMNHVLMFFITDGNFSIVVHNN